MYVLVADLHEDGADGQPVTQIGQVGVDTVFPGVAERLDLFGLTADVGLLAVLDVARPGRDLPVRVKFDAVGRIEIDASRRCVVGATPQSAPPGRSRQASTWLLVSLMIALSS